MRFWQRITRTLIIALVIPLGSGCASSAKHVSAVAAYDRGQPQEALQQLTEASAKRGAEREILQIDEAICRLMSGETRQAEHTLHAVREQLEFLSQKDVAEQTASLLTDDKAIAWTGQDYERRMLDCLLILASLAGDRQDAFAFASRASEGLMADQHELRETNDGAHERASEVAVQESSSAEISVIPVGHATEDAVTVPPQLGTNALAAFLIAAVHSELPMNGDNMHDALRQVGFWQPSAAPEVADLQIGVHTPADHGTLHVVTLVGRVTDWKSEAVIPSSAALLLADQILSANSDHSLPPTVAPVRIGRPATPDSQHPGVTTVSIVGSDSSAAINSCTLLDLNLIAQQSYLANRDRVVAKAVARRIVKKGVVYATKNQLDIDRDSGADLLLSLGGAAWEALEKPDVRHARLLPERVEVAMVTLPTGDYQVQLGTSSGRGADATDPAANESTRVQIVNGRNTFLLCFRPDDHVSHVVGGLR